MTPVPRVVPAEPEDPVRRAAVHCLQRFHDWGLEAHGGWPCIVDLEIEGWVVVAESCNDGSPLLSLYRWADLEAWALALPPGTRPADWPVPPVR